LHREQGSAPESIEVVAGHGAPPDVAGLPYRHFCGAPERISPDRGAGSLEFVATVGAVSVGFDAVSRAVVVHPAAVSDGTDLSQTGMQDITIRFARAARTADVALFYYSGHAMQYAGANYLEPIDADLHDVADLRRMIRVDEILADVQQARPEWTSAVN
jgi:hypothetical protein